MLKNIGDDKMNYIVLDFEFNQAFDFVENCPCDPFPECRFEIIQIGAVKLDDNFKEISKDEFGNLLLPPSEFNANLSELEIPSPGFPRTHELVQKAKNLISEYDYFDDFNGVKIWISGTNGKTTTTQMTQSLLENYGSAMGGNVGVPLANLDKNAKIWVLETSSFTMPSVGLVWPCAGMQNHAIFIPIHLHSPDQKLL